MIKKTVVLGMLIAGALILCLTACSGKEPIVGTWEGVSSATVLQANGDGTFASGGTWEKCSWMPTVEAEGKEWSVYIFIPASRTVVGEGELGNTYKYDDEFGDYFFLVSGDEMAITIGAGNIENIVERGTISSSSKDSGYTRV